MILYLDTTEPGRILVGLVAKQEMISKLELTGEFHQSERLLSLIDKLLKRNKASLKDLTGIIVIIGPGGFTAVRLGVVIANTLGFALNLPIAGLTKFPDSQAVRLIAEGLKLIRDRRPGEGVQPVYGREPSITKPKLKSD